MADILGLLTICRKAGKLVLGTDEVKTACRNGKALGVVTVSDFSQKSFKEISFVCSCEGVPLYKSEHTLNDMGDALGKVYGVFAVTDSGFMKSFAKKLQKVELPKSYDTFR